MPRRRFWVVILGLSALGYVGWRLSPLGVIYTHRRENDGNYGQHSFQYEAILANLKKLEMPDRRAAYFYIAADRNPSSLRRLEHEELNKERFNFIKTGCYLELSWLEDGSVVAVFYNKDLGPFGGTFGTIHSPVIPSSAQVGLIGQFKQVAPNWWAGHFD
jgi:hypothetical protein